MFRYFKIKQAWFALAFLLFSPQALSHQDMDLSIEGLSYDASCQLTVTVVNQGRALPKIFYSKHSTSRLTVAKGTQTALSPFLYLLDKERRLQRKGGRLQVRIEEPFINNPAPFEIQLSDFEELRDFNPRNNRRYLSNDCRLGIGVIEGNPLVFDQPDLVVYSDHHSMDHCILDLHITNLLDVPLPESVWNENDGAVIKVVDIESGEHLLTEAIMDVDSDGSLRKKNSLHWRWDIKGIGAEHIRVGVWYVEGEKDFRNNQLELQVPAQCL